MAWDIGICAILLRWKRRSVYFSNANHGLTRVSGSMRSRHDRVVCYEPSSCQERICATEPVGTGARESPVLKIGGFQGNASVTRRCVSVVMELKELGLPALAYLLPTWWRTGQRGR